MALYEFLRLTYFQRVISITALSHLYNICMTYIISRRRRARSLHTEGDVMHAMQEDCGSDRRKVPAQ